MSSAQPKEVRVSDSYAANPADAHSAFCEDIANGLHAMAQPLTILRGALGVLTGPEANGRDHRRYLEMSTLQIERLCDLVAQMQKLVDTHHFPAELAPLDLDALISPIVDDIKVVVEGMGLTMTVAKPEAGLSIVADRERTKQAVQSILKVFASISSPGDVIGLSVLQHDGFVELVVESQNGHGRNFNSLERLSLSLAEANIRTHYGAYRCVESPARVTLALPASNINRNEDGVEGRCSSCPEAFARLSQLSY